MLVKPNKTIVRGRVRATRATPGGGGRELDLDVTENRTPAPDLDFLKPEAGGSMTLHCNDPAELTPGDLVEIEATLLAGPFGERAVLQKVRKLKP